MSTTWICPLSTYDCKVILNSGYADKSSAQHFGGGANYICLDKNPQWPDVTSAGSGAGNNIYGVEYWLITGFDYSFFNNDALCATCHVEGRGETLMIPGNRTCPHTWTKEYEGLLVSEDTNLSTYVCLDKNPEAIPGWGFYDEWSKFYILQAHCNPLPCPPYVNGYEIACVVCTH